LLSELCHLDDPFAVMVPPAVGAFHRFRNHPVSKH
jgi:hypothetical protein